MGVFVEVIQSNVFASVAQLLLSVGEVWICYKLLYITVLDEIDCTKRDYVMMWSNIIIVGTLLFLNRLISFFSFAIQWLSIILTCFNACFRKKKKILIIGIIIIYYLMVAILDVVFGFGALEILY